MAIGDDKYMSWTPNETFEQRKLKKPFVYIKYHLNNKLITPLKDIRIDNGDRSVHARLEEQVCGRQGLKLRGRMGKRKCCGGFPGHYFFIGNFFSRVSRMDQEKKWL